MTTTPSEQPGPVELDPVGATLLTAYRTLGQQIADLEAKRQEIRAGLEAILGDATEATVDGQTVITWRWSKPRQTFDRKAFAAEHPDIYARYVTYGEPTRSLRIVDPEA